MMLERRSVVEKRITDLFPVPVYVLQGGLMWMPHTSGLVEIVIQDFECASERDGEDLLRKIIGAAPGTAGIIYERQPWAAAENGRVRGRFGIAVWSAP